MLYFFFNLARLGSTDGLARLAQYSKKLGFGSDRRVKKPARSDTSVDKHESIVQKTLVPNSATRATMIYIGLKMAKIGNLNPWSPWWQNLESIFFGQLIHAFKTKINKFPSKSGHCVMVVYQRA